ncbi:epimerase [Kiloniella spongiae]|uniref:Epimerase n=1 Tax=Kiloniella spongiae TaxID=1489064 RepID=A0A0H2MDW3_9PROT|nr:NmrA family NAD(P)-binding protein [Kiloniella spongiae]KLN60553.1 epimerase [Kiloniella spongiae]
MTKTELYAVTGVSGRTGAAVARTLLAAGKGVRVIVRTQANGAVWANQGAEVAVANLTDITALSNALSGTEGAYIISPPQYAQDELFKQADVMAETIAEASIKARLPKLVALSSIGADKSKGIGLISMNRTLEQSLEQTGLPVTFLRAAYFMENWSPMIQSALQQGSFSSFLSPLNRKIPMIATDDIGRIAAEALNEHWEKTRVIELEGPRPYSPNDLANSLTQRLGKAVNVKAIAEADWAKALLGSGMSAAAIDGFITMTQALNSGHIGFSDKSKIDRRKGSTTIDDIVTEISS